VMHYIDASDDMLRKEVELAWVRGFLLSVH